jgi:hypothetical protein
MLDPISVISGGISIVQGLWQFLSFVRGVAGADIISAYFKWDGTRLEGSERIVVDKQEDGSDPHSWWFSVREESDYVYVRYPVVESCAHELVGQVTGEANPDARYWRWVAPMPQGVIAGSQRPNLAVNFIVVGYRPKALVEHFSSTHRKHR